MIYLSLFWAFFKIALFSVGGGYAVLPMIQREIVENSGWITFAEFNHLLTISQMTPGPIALNAATFVGLRVAGFGGSLAATGGCVAPACVIMLALAWLYQKYSNLDRVEGALKGLRPASVALIASAGASIVVNAIWGGNGFSLAFNGIDPAALAIFAISLVAIRMKANTYYVVLGAGLVALLAQFLTSQVIK